MNPSRVVTCLADAYDRSAAQYRRDDEIETQSENHRRLGGNLRRICRSFPHPIRVLEIGCGTGRYFHWLEQVQLLVGTDLSRKMLKCAEHPVCGSDVTAQEVRLMQGDIYELEFESESFDFIYSLGVLGYGAELTPALATKLHRWLAPGGRLYFDAIEELVWRRIDRLKEAVKRVVYPRLPADLQARLQARDTMPVHYHSRAQIEARLEAAGFRDFALSSNRCKSPLWTGSHLECVGRKCERVPATAAPRRRRRQERAVAVA